MELEDDAVGREGPVDPPTAVTVALGALAAVLVGLTAATTVRAGLASVGVGFVAAAGILVATVGIFELGQRVGSE